MRRVYLQIAQCSLLFWCIVLCIVKLQAHRIIVFYKPRIVNIKSFSSIIKSKNIFIYVTLQYMSITYWKQILYSFTNGIEIFKIPASK